MIKNKQTSDYFKGATVIAQYQNGNYTVLILSDGTKIRYNEEDKLIPEYPESIDCCVSRRCRQGCLFCYENCLPTGNHADPDLLTAAFWDDLPPYIEIAINGNDMDWHMLPDYLVMLHKKQAIVNITVTMKQFIENWKQIHHFQNEGLIKAVGISIGHLDTWNIDVRTAEVMRIPGVQYMTSISSTYTQDNNSVIQKLCDCKNIVFHSVLGLNDADNIIQFTEGLRKLGYNNPVKILFLGYKTKGRGQIYGKMYNKDIVSKIKDIEDSLSNLQNTVDVIAFDNLGVEQLHLEAKFPESEWSKKYMGNDGHFSMYIDGVSMTYGLNSYIPDNERIKYTGESLKEMFQTIRKENNITD